MAWEAACWAAGPHPTSTQIWALAPAPVGEAPGARWGSQVLVTLASPEEEAVRQILSGRVVRTSQLQEKG